LIESIDAKSLQIAAIALRIGCARRTEIRRRGTSTFGRESKITAAQRFHVVTGLSDQLLKRTAKLRISGSILRT
jgi:hypothetical protein